MTRIGQGIDRVDGRLKVTGQAIFTADIPAEQLAYGVLVSSTIASGRIRRIDTTAAETSPGVVRVFTHLNLPPYPGEAPTPPMNEARLALSDDVVHYVGQYVALVIADSLEQAEYAAELISVTYDETPAVTTLEAGRDNAFIPEAGGLVFFPTGLVRGEFDSAFASSPVKLEQNYSTAKYLHTPMETSATMAVWEGEQLTVFDATQWIVATKTAVATVLGLDPETVRVISNFIGGGFGAKGLTWPHTVLTAHAARAVDRPLKIQLTRTQMQTCIGYQPSTQQTLRISATEEGRLQAVYHATVCQSGINNFVEPTIAPTHVLYDIPNLTTEARIVKTNHVTGTTMRTPGEVSGLFALESALDELAYQLGVDPIDLRRLNYAERNLEVNKPFSAKGLLACYEQGAARFGWEERNPAPRSVREGRELVGYGMASATRQQHQMDCQAQVLVRADGTAVVRTGVAEIGGGAYTIMVQIAAEDLGLPYERVTIEGGDSVLPMAAGSWGSMTAVATANAVKDGAMKARAALIELARADNASPLFGAEASDIAVQDNRLVLASDPAKSDSHQEIMSRAGRDEIIGDGEFVANTADSPFSIYTFGAQFAEVRVDEELGIVRVSRFVSALSAGRIHNEKTATSQAKGGIIYAIGPTLSEGVRHDFASGRLLNGNLFDYLVPVNADIPSSNIDIIFVDDSEGSNTLGSKGIGEIVCNGVNAAIANAVYHATGKRVRDLPITIERVLAA